MDELELVRRFYGEVPDADEVARGRALDRLRRGASPRRRGRLATGVVGAAAAVLALILSFGALSRGPAEHPGGESPSASEASTAELLRLARLAAGHDLAAGARPVVYEQTESLEPDSFEDLSGGGRFVVDVRRRTEIWRSPDGSILQIRTVRAISFPGEEDRAAWSAAKDAGLPVPEVGDVVRERVPPGEIPFPDLTDLPLDAAPLIGRLRERSEEPLDDDAAVLAAIAELLARGDASPELRVALFQAATTLDGVQLLGRRTDPLGREGEALGAGDIVVVVDPDTSFVLSIEERLGLLLSWRTYTVSATVDAPGERPTELT